jgi:hypothetical protein
LQDDYKEDQTECVKDKDVCPQNEHFFKKYLMSVYKKSKLKMNITEQVHKEEIKEQPFQHTKCTLYSILAVTILLFVFASHC